MRYFDYDRMQSGMRVTYAECLMVCFREPLPSVTVAAEIGRSYSYTNKLLESAAWRGDLIRFVYPPRGKVKSTVYYGSIEYFERNIGIMPQSLLDLNLNDNAVISFHTLSSCWTIQTGNGTNTIRIDQQSGIVEVLKAVSE